VNIADVPSPVVGVVHAGSAATAALRRIRLRYLDLSRWAAGKQRTYIGFRPSMICRQAAGCPFFVRDGVILRVPKNWGTVLGKVIRRLVWERDEWTCRLCGATAQPSDSPISTSLSKVDRFPHPLYADHILPRRFGGTNHPNNLQTLCAGCNTTKANSEERESAWRKWE
jgi:hypothetical protein